MSGPGNGFEKRCDENGLEVPLYGDGEDAERGHADRRSAEPEARRADGRRGRTKVKPRRDARRNW